MAVSLPIGFYPFWFWNDRLSAEEIRWQIHEMADKGVRGFFIHPRQGLGQPYLSEAFLEMVDVAVAAAEELGLYVHLYDEYPYPSGVAGGAVILGSPEYYATQLVQVTYDVAGGFVRLELPVGKVLCCMAYPMRSGQVDWSHGLDLRSYVGPQLIKESYVETGLTQYNQKRYFASEPTPVLEAHLPEGSWRIYVSVQAEVSHHKYWDHFVDVFNPDAVRRFIELTHEKYRRRYEGRFGKSIISIFVDETQPGWSARLPAAFREEYGYDLLSYLPALQDTSHPDHLRVAYDLYRLRYRLFCESFERPLSEWCAAHGLAYSGEKPSLRMSQLSYMHIPGCEPGHVKAGAPLDLLQGHLRQNARATASAAYFYRKMGSLCECYHSMGWSATLQDAKLIAEGLLLLGISYLVPHGFFYSTHGLKKHDAPPTFFFQMPFWPHFGELSARVDKIGQLFGGTHIDAELLVVDPSSGLPTRDQVRAYEALLATLMSNHLDFHIVDTDILLNGEVKGSQLHVADIVAKAVVVPPMRVVEEPLANWLEKFQKAGGAVLYYQPQESLGALLGRLLQYVQPSLNVRVDGQEAAAVQVVKRVGPGRTLWFVLNTGAQALEAEILSAGPIRELPLDERLPALLEGRNGRYRRVIRPFESFMLEAVASDVASTPMPCLTVPMSGPALLHPENPNLLRLYRWRMSLQGPDGEYGREATVSAVPISNQLQSAGLMFRPEIRTFFGHEPELAWPKLSVRYESEFLCDYTGEVQLVMEPGSIVGEWRIWVNGRGPLTMANFSETKAHVRGSLGVDITSYLVQGNNRLQVEVTTDRSDGGLRNPLYLAGSFGVELNPAHLVPPKKEGHFEDYEGNLLPFYAGAILYITTFSLDAMPEGEHALVAFQYDVPFHEASEVSINGGPFLPVLWEPRCVAVPTKLLRVGQNSLATRVYTSLVRSFEGQWFDYAAHKYRDVGKQLA